MKKLFFSLFIILINYNQNVIGMDHKPYDMFKNRDVLRKKKDALQIELVSERGPQTDRFSFFNMPQEVLQMFEKAFKEVETRRYLDQSPEWGIQANMDIAPTRGVKKAVDFTQTAFDNIKNHLMNHDTQKELYNIYAKNDDLHAYIFEYYYWKVFQISLKWEDSLQVAKSRNKAGFIFFLVQGIMLVIPACSNWKDAVYRDHPGILPYNIELAMSVLGVFGIYCLLPLPGALLPKDPLLQHSIKYQEIAEHNTESFHPAEESEVVEFSKEHVKKFMKDLFSLKDFRKGAGKFLHDLHLYIEGKELKRGFISFVAITSFLTFIMYFMQGENDVSMNHLPHWIGFEYIMHNLLLVAKSAPLDMGGRTRGWDISNVFYGEDVDQTWTRWFTNKVPTDFVMLLVLFDIKLFKMFLVGLVKMLSKQRYLQWFFKWARGVFMQTYDPSDTTGNLRKMVAPFAYLFTSAFLFHLIKVDQHQQGAVNADDYGDISGVLGLVAFMYPVFLMPNLSYKQLKNMPFEKIKGNEERFTYIAKIARNNASSVFVYGMHTLLVGYMCGAWLGLGTPQKYVTAIAETFMVLPGYYGIILFLELIYQMYKGMMKKFWKPVKDEEFGSKITLSNAAYGLTWGFLFIAIMCLCSWNNHLKSLGGEGEHVTGAIKEYFSNE